MAAPITDIGNGVGRLYITEVDGTTPITDTTNDSTGVALLRSNALTVGPLSGSGSFDATYGRRYFINASVSAPVGDVTGATEITDQIVNRGTEQNVDKQSVILASDEATFSRRSNTTILVVDTEGGAPTDTLSTITANNVADGDILIIQGLAASKVTTVDTANNISLSGPDFATGDISLNIILKYDDATSSWGEVARSGSSIGAGAVGTSEIASGAVTTDKLATDSVTADKIATGAVGSDEIATDAVGSDEIAAEAVGIDELAATLKEEVLNYTVSMQDFDPAPAAVSYECGVEVPYNCTVTKVRGEVVVKLGDVEVGEIQMKNNAGTNMANGLLSFIACALPGVDASVSPTTNNTFTTGQLIKMQVDKPTQGGLINVQIFVTRT